MITYSVPVRQNGVFVGVVTMDVQLDSSSEVMNVGQDDDDADAGVWPLIVTRCYDSSSHHLCWGCDR